MLWYHAGFRAAPFVAATISQLPSGPGHQPTGLVRSAPLLTPTVVRIRPLNPSIFPLRRKRLAAFLLTSRRISPARGWRPPRVPAGVSKLRSLIGSSLSHRAGHDRRDLVFAVRCLPSPVRRHNHPECQAARPCSRSRSVCPAVFARPAAVLLVSLASSG